MHAYSLRPSQHSSSIAHGWAAHSSMSNMQSVPCVPAIAWPYTLPKYTRVHEYLYCESNARSLLYLPGTLRPHPFEARLPCLGSSHPYRHSCACPASPAERKRVPRLVKSAVRSTADPRNFLLHEGPYAKHSLSTIVIDRHRPLVDLLLKYTSACHYTCRTSRSHPLGLGTNKHSKYVDHSKWICMWGRVSLITWRHTKGQGCRRVPLSPAGVPPWSGCSIDVQTSKKQVRREL